MNVILNHKEITEAIIAYVDDQGISLKDKKTEVNLVAGRGPNGHTAEINITPETVSVTLGQAAASEETAQVNLLDPVENLDKVHANSQFDPSVQVESPEFPDAGEASPLFNS